MTAPRTPISPGGGGSGTGTGGLPENVTLRIVILAHGNRAEDDLYLVLGLDSTVGDLKTRIQNALSARPEPAIQRLIYHGRPLLQDHVTLRSILRQASTSHVVHLVIRLPQEVQPPSTPTQQAQIPGQGQNRPLPPAHDPAQLSAPQRAHHAEADSDHSQDRQEHIAQLFSNNFNRPGGTLPPRPQPLPPHLHNHHDGLGRPQLPSQLPLPNFAHPPQHIHHGQHGHQHPQQPHAPHVTRIEETIGPDGERIRTVINSTGNGTNMHFQMMARAMPNPLDRPSSAPGSSPPATSDSTTQNANPAPPSFLPHLPQTQIPRISLPPPPNMMTGFGPFMVPGMGQLPHQGTLSSLPSTFAHLAPSLPTTAWLLNSPSGPQAIVFSPAHGVFQNAPVNQIDSATTTHPIQQAHPTPTPTTQPVPPNPANQPAQPAQPNHPNVGHPPVPAAPPVIVRPNPVNDPADIIQLLITRGWLFFRLYLFIFIFSESGSWRRVLLLAAAIIFCLLPANNPLSEGMQLMRRHIETLLGPPQIPQRQPREANQPQATGVRQQDGVQGPAASQAQAQAGRPSNAPTASTTQGPRGRAPSMPSPEETARRLLRQHINQNPYSLSNILYRIEQAIALFLASLVPGVGERHVRAREDARRVLDEERAAQDAETERLRLEAEEQEKKEDDGANEAGKTDVGSRGSEEAEPSAAVTASGLETRDEEAGGDLRARAAAL